jgi:hypothetical protein
MVTETHKRHIASAAQPQPFGRSPIHVPLVDDERPRRRQHDPAPA